VDVVVVNGRQEGAGINEDSHLVRSNYVLLDLGLAGVNDESIAAVRHFITIQLGNKVFVVGMQSDALSV